MNKHLKLNQLVICIFLSIIILNGNGLSQQQPTNPDKKMKALFVWGGWDGHEPDKCRDIFVPWLKENGFEVRVGSTLLVANFIVQVLKNNVSL